jgi:hypothetical protein
MYAKEDIFCFHETNLLTYDFNFVCAPRVALYLFGQSNRYRTSRLNPVLTGSFAINKSAILGKIAVSAGWFAVHITLLTDGGRSVRLSKSLSPPLSWTLFKALVLNSSGQSVYETVSWWLLRTCLLVKEDPTRPGAFPIAPHSLQQRWLADQLVTIAEGVLTSLWV